MHAYRCSLAVQQKVEMDESRLIVISVTFVGGGK